MADSPNEEQSAATLDATVDRIGEAVYGPSSDPGEGPGMNEVTSAHEDEAAPSSVAPASTDASTSPTVYEPPKSWKQEMHPYWQKTDPKVQSYYLEREKQMLDGLEQYKTDATYAKQLRESLAPYRQTIQQLGLNEIQAAKSLFQADHLLRHAPPEQKRAYAQQLLKNYGIDLAASTESATSGDPIIDKLQQRLDAIQQRMTEQDRLDLERHQEEVAVRHASIMKDLNAFADDTAAHPYFDEVAYEIATFVSSGKSLQDAYDAAVWTNPVTRQKELARVQTEHEAKLKETARVSVPPKKRATGVNVRANDHGSTQTEPLGTLEDTIKGELRRIRSVPA